MNTKRIVTGGVLAGLGIFFLDWVIHGWLLGPTWKNLELVGITKSPQGYTMPVIFVQELVVGLVLCWLYVLARPSLGPGPKTAFIMGTLAWLLLYLPYGITQWLWLTLPAKVGWVGTLGGLVQCWAATYVAGWQYIERAP